MQLDLVPYKIFLIVTIFFLQTDEKWLVEQTGIGISYMLVAKKLNCSKRNKCASVST